MGDSVRDASQRKVARQNDSRNLLGARPRLLRCDLLVDLRFLDQGVENVEDRVARPDLSRRIGTQPPDLEMSIPLVKKGSQVARSQTNLRVLPQHRQLVLTLVFHARPPLRERLKLVDELVEHVPNRYGRVSSSSIRQADEESSSPEPLDGEVQGHGRLGVCYHPSRLVCAG